MKNIINKTAVVIFGAALATGAQSKEALEKKYPLVSLHVKVADEESNGLKNMLIAAGDSLGGPKEITSMESKTDQNGNGILTFRALMPPWLMCRGDGWYQSRMRVQFPSPFIFRKGIPESEQVNAPYKKEIRLESSVGMRKKIKPIPLYAKHVRIEFPANNKWLGYDLEVGDWTPPYGEGVLNDLMFRVVSPKLVSSKDEHGVVRRGPHANTEASLEIDFGANGGFINVTKENGFLAESDMQMPHLAFQKGYDQQVFRKVIKNYNESIEVIPHIGRFFRMRVKVVGDEVVQANYGKIMGDVHYNPFETVKKFGTNKGKIIYGFADITYYFNPILNDRNLELHPPLNLMSDGNVTKP